MSSARFEVSCWQEQLECEWNAKRQYCEADAQSSDGFAHRLNRPWPRALRFWGPSATLFCDDSILTKHLLNCADHNFTIYVETNGNANVYSICSYQYSKNTTILCIWACERCRPSARKRLQKKNEKEKNGIWLMFNFPLTKSSQQRKTARHCKTLMKSNILSIASYVWLLLLDFQHAEIACWTSFYMLDKPARKGYR